MALDPILERRLHEVGLRRHLQGRLDAAAAALAAACVALAALRVGLWLFGPAVAAGHPLPWLWLAVPLGALGAGGWVWWRRRQAAPSPLETARFLDRELRLEDRLATAVELYGPHAAAGAADEAPRGAVGALLHYDAAAHAQRVDPEAAVPPRWPAGLGRLSAGLLAAVIVLLPIFPASPLRPQAQSAAAAEQALMRARGEEIQQLAEQLQAQAKAEPDSAAADMAAQLQSLAQQMIGSQLTPEQAQRLLSQLQARLSTVDRERANAALSQLEAAQRAGISPDEMRALAEKLTEAASQPTPPSLAQQSDLARQLRALQDRLGGDSSLSRALQRISNELENGDVAQAARDLSALNRQLSAQQQAAQNVPGGRPTESAGGTSGAQQSATGGGAPPTGTPGDEADAPDEGGGTHTPGNMQAGGQAGAGGSNEGGGHGSGTGDGPADDGEGRMPANAVQYTPAPITGDLRGGAPNIAALPGLPNQAAPSTPAGNYAPSAAGGGGEQAVTQERVPIVYRQWVKRYFDS